MSNHSDTTDTTIQDLYNKMKYYSISQCIIHVNKLSDDSFIFGALMFEITKFCAKGQLSEKGPHVLIFYTKDHGAVYCSLSMAWRIKKRLDVNGYDSSEIEKGLGIYGLELELAKIIPFPTPIQRFPNLCDRLEPAKIIPLHRHTIQFETL